MNDKERALERQAIQWVRSNMKKLKREICDPDTYPKEDKPVTIFMAGTPGAGKTEFSVSLLEEFKTPIIRIDADEIREMMRSLGYDGANAHCYQRAAGNAVNNLYGHAIHHSQSALMDGTFTYSDWRGNVERSLEKKRLVEIYYLYQDPVIAWGYVEKRRRKQGRAVPRHIFIDDYFTSMKNVSEAKKIFGDKITLYFAKNNYQKRLEYIKIDVDSIEEMLPKVYNRMKLESLLENV